MAGSKSRLKSNQHLTLVAGEDTTSIFDSDVTVLNGKGEAMTRLSWSNTNLAVVRSLRRRVPGQEGRDAAGSAGGSAGSAGGAGGEGGEEKGNELDTPWPTAGEELLDDRQNTNKKPKNKDYAFTHFDVTQAGEFDMTFSVMSDQQVR